MYVQLLLLEKKTYIHTEKLFLNYTYRIYSNSCEKPTICHALITRARIGAQGRDGGSGQRLGLRARMGAQDRDGGSGFPVHEHRGQGSLLSEVGVDEVPGQWLLSRAEAHPRLGYGEFLSPSTKQL